MSERYSIGRADAAKADILIAGDTVSAMHAELLKEGGRIYIRDIGSRNGTVIVRASKRFSVGDIPVYLKSGDIIRFGREELQAAELLDRLVFGSRHTFANGFDEGSLPGDGKMRRCLSCGSVTPEGAPCVSCGSVE